MSDRSNSVKRKIKHESALFAGLLFFGLAVMPVAIYIVGQSLLGEYGGQGYGDFFGALSDKIRSADPVAWFLVLSPYFVWQTLRLMVYGWRRAAEAQQ